MNFKEIVEQLNKSVTKDGFIHGDFNSEDIGLGKSEEVDSYGGEGQGGTYFTVVYFIDHDVYVKLDGYYTSYDGVDTNDYDYTEVKPQEKTITVYE